MIVIGRVAWFDLAKKYGFVTFDGVQEDAFLHVATLKAAGYVSLPAGTTLRVKVEQQGGRRRVTEVLEVDVRTALHGEAPAIRRKEKD